MGAAWRRTLRRLVSSAYVRPALGLLVGALTAAAALAVDSAVQGPAGGVAVSTGNARPLLGSVVGGTITITALVFWVRGMFVQLAAAQLPSQVVRWYLDDPFLQWTLALILATFSHACVVLLALPGEVTAAAPTVGVLLAALLAGASLAAVVVTITDSMEDTDEGHVLASLTRQAIATLKQRFPFPGDGDGSGRPVVVAADAPSQAVPAPVSGWVDAIDAHGLLAAVPDGHHLDVLVGPGMFVAEGGSVATLHGPRADGHDPARLQRAFSVAARRDPSTDPHLAVGRLVDIALDQLSGRSRTAGHEALLHLGLILREAFRHELSGGQVTGDDSRSIRWHAALSHKDILAEVVRPLHEAGAVTSPVAVTLLRALGLVARDVRASGGDRGRLALLEDEARRVLASLPHDGAWGPTEDPHQVADEEGLLPADRRSPVGDGAS